MLARMFSGAGIDFVSNNGVLDTGEEGFMLELGVMIEIAEVKDRLGVISIVFENVRVTVMNLVLF